MQPQPVLPASDRVRLAPAEPADYAEQKNAGIERPEGVRRQAFASDDDQIGRACLAHGKSRRKIDCAAPLHPTAPRCGSDRAKAAFQLIKRDFQVADVLLRGEGGEANAAAREGRVRGAGRNADKGCVDAVSQSCSQTHTGFRGDIEVNMHHHGRISHDTWPRQQT